MQVDEKVETVKEEPKAEKETVNVSDIVTSLGFAPIEKPTAKEVVSKESKEATKEKKEESKTPTSESVTDEKGTDEQHKGFQKRIDKLTYEKKAAVEEAERLKKELESLKGKKEESSKKEPENKDDNKDFVLSDEQFKDAVYNKATARIMAEDKDKPLDQRRILTAEEMDELLLESPAKFTKWDRKFGDFETKLEKSIAAEIEASKKKEPEKKQDVEKETVKKRETDYSAFVSNFPHLNFMEILKDIPREMLTEDNNEKLISEIKKKNEEVGEFFEFVNKNFEKYSEPSTWVKAATEFEKQKLSSTKAALEKKIEEQKAEIERLSNIDGNVRSTRPSTPVERKDTELNGVIDSVLKRTPFSSR